MDKERKKSDKPFLSFSCREVLVILILFLIASLGLRMREAHINNSAYDCRARGGFWVDSIKGLTGYCEEPAESGSAAMFIPFLTILTTARRNDDDEPKTMYGAADDALAAGPAGAESQPPGR